MTWSLRDRLPVLWASPERDPWLRAALTPLSWLYALGQGGVASVWDRGWRAQHEPELPTISIGNLTVGGTGKTPVASWVADWWLRRGVRPAIVLRGYGADEEAVHRRLLPDAVVVAGSDRVRAIAQARAEGAEVVVLDDGFQHRRVRRALDLVLVSVEQVAAELFATGRWRAPLLPAGPYREPPTALHRAHAIILTRKSADDATVARVAHAVGAMAPALPIIVAGLRPGGLVPVGGTPRASQPPLAGGRVLAIAGIGAPTLFAAQLTALGATVTLRAFPDHHAFSSADIGALVASAREADLAVCTLKDAVKLAPMWPRSATALSFLSQHCVIEQGSDRLDALLATVRPRVA